MKIEVINGGKSRFLQSAGGSNLMDCLLGAGLLPATECAGRGICGKCDVIVHSGHLEPVSAEEGAPGRQPHGRTLACQSLVTGDVVVEIPSVHDDVVRKVRLHRLQAENAFVDAPVEKRFLSLTAPSLQDQTPDLERVLAQLGSGKKVSRRLLQKLPTVLRKSDFLVTAVLVGEDLIDVEPGDTRSCRYGFVFDLGTTTIAGYLIDLCSGAVLGAEGRANPQRVFGADVLSRIAAVTERPELLDEMQALTVEAVALMMRDLLDGRGIEEAVVYSVAVVGNTTMSHFFLGFDPGNLALAPFIPCCQRPPRLNGGELGLPMHPEGEVYVLPNISGYLGSDILGVVMAAGLPERAGYTLAVDIGTNGEIVLAGNGRMTACSTAAGPAFEGAHIQNGMRAGAGAVEAVRIENGTVMLSVIGGGAPRGICGSGLIDAVAALLQNGLIDAHGRFAVEDARAPAESLRARLRTNDGRREFVLAFAGEHGNEQDIVVGRQDICELQLAKGAIAAGIQVLAEEMGIVPGRIDRVFLAGAFGNYINRESAVALGMFPDITIDKIFPVGNAAGEGAGLSLLSLAQRESADRLAAAICPVELSACAAFNGKFIRAMSFPTATATAKP